MVAGGPGAGKTSVIERLQAMGHSGLPEPGREILEDQRLIDGKALPWTDPVLFGELVLAEWMRLHRTGLELPGDWVFCDRAIPDMAAYYQLVAQEVPAHVDAAIRQFRYHPRVFFLAPWEQIYAGDNDRTQTFEEASSTGGLLGEVYHQYGYELVDVPAGSVEERCAFILGQVGDLAAEQVSGNDRPEG